MKRFQDRSIKQKLIWMSMFASITALFLALTGFISYEMVSLRRTMVRDLSVKAAIIGYNVSSALVFNDPISAAETLQALKAKPGIVAAAVYDKEGRLFASYIAKNIKTKIPLPPEIFTRQEDGFSFEKNGLFLFQQIRLEGDAIGMIYLNNDLRELQKRYQLYALIVSVVLALSLLVAWYVSMVMQKRISLPIVHLSHAAQNISEKKDYSIRAEKETRDEVGNLVEAFNDMLSQIQVRDTDLQRARDGLGIQVKERTKDLEQEIGVRKIAEVALRDSEDKWRRLFEESYDAIFVADAVTGEILDCNYAATTLIGRSKEELIGQHQRILHPYKEPSEQFTETFKRHRADMQDQVLETQVITKDGRLKEVEIKASIINLGGRKVIQGAFRDISDRKAAQEKLRHAMDELSRSNAELQQFAYVASHDLQEPLRMVASFSQLLEKRYKDKLDADADEFIEFIVDGANRMQTLINDLLQYSRVGTRGRPFAATDMSVALGQALSNLRATIEENTAIVTNEDLPVVIADETQMTQVFQNLISNAVKFRGKDTPSIHIKSRKEDSEWVFSVHDNGIGIAPEYFDKIFVIFQRLHTRKEYIGTGIGLAICKRIIDRHGGRIWVESEPEKGSTFYFTLPIRIEKGVDVYGTATDETH